MSDTNDAATERVSEATKEKWMDILKSGKGGAASSLPDLAGLPYTEVLRMFHRELRPRTYLEIGTATGDSLVCASCPSIAIDPEMHLRPDVLNGKSICACYQITSDRYFEQYDPQAILGGPIEMAFLDGMHRSEFVLRDFVNIERHCKRNSIIFIHDCVPVETLIADRVNCQHSVEPHRKGWWIGDVWRALLALKSRRPDLRTTVLDAFPTGLACISDLDPSSTTLSDNYYAIVEQMLSWSLEEIGLIEYHRMVNVEPTSVVDSYEKITRRVWL
jgi:hypothetical protein